MNSALRPHGEARTLTSGSRAALARGSPPSRPCSLLDREERLPGTGASVREGSGGEKALALPKGCKRGTDVCPQRPLG